MGRWECFWWLSLCKKYGSCGTHVVGTGIQTCLPLRFQRSFYVLDRLTTLLCQDNETTFSWPIELRFQWYWSVPGKKSGFPPFSGDRVDTEDRSFLIGWDLIGLFYHPMKISVVFFLARTVTCENGFQLEGEADMKLTEEEGLPRLSKKLKKRSVVVSKQTLLADYKQTFKYLCESVKGLNTHTAQFATWLTSQLHMAVGSTANGTSWRSHIKNLRQWRKSRHSW